MAHPQTQVVVVILQSWPCKKFSAPFAQSREIQQYCAESILLRLPRVFPLVHLESTCRPEAPGLADHHRTMNANDDCVVAFRQVVSYHDKPLQNVAYLANIGLEWIARLLDILPLRKSSVLSPSPIYLSLLLIMGQLLRKAHVDQKVSHIRDIPATLVRDETRNVVLHTSVPGHMEFFRNDAFPIHHNISKACIPKKHANRNQYVRVKRKSRPHL